MKEKPSAPTIKPGRVVGKTRSCPLSTHTLQTLIKMAVVCYRHWFSLSQSLRLAFLKRQKSNIQALRSSKFAKYSQGCTHPRPFSWMTHSLRSQNNSKPSPCVRLLKPTMWSGRHFIFNVFHLTILHLLIVSKITIQQSFYRLFPTLPCKQFKLEWPWTKKLKLKHLHAVFAMLWLLGILKISGFVFVRI